MADNDNKPTPEQVEAANQAEFAKWEGDFDPETLKIPYKREDDAAKQTGNDKTDGTGDVNNDKAPTGTQPVHATDTGYQEPAPVVTVQDPGDYQPADYSFEVTLKDGKTVNVTSPEEAEKLADDPDNFATPKQLMDFIRKSTSMSTKLERDREKWEAAKTEYDRQTAEEKKRTDTVTTIAAEFNYLVSKGMLPGIDPQYESRDWSDADVASQPGVKEQLALLDYIARENIVRAKAGIAPLSSAIDAYNGWKIEQDRQQATDEQRQAGAARRAAGARVAGVSPANQTPYVPRGISVGRPGVFKRGASVWSN